MPEMSHQPTLPLLSSLCNADSQSRLSKLAQSMRTDVPGDSVTAVTTDPSGVNKKSGGLQKHDFSISASFSAEDKPDPVWVLKRQMKRSVPKFEETFEEFAVFDILKDDWSHLQPPEWNFTQEGENDFGEQQSFVIKDCKSYKCSQIEFHPIIKSVFAVAYGQYLEFEERINKRSGNRHQLEPRFVFIWSLHDHLQPLLKLCAYEEVTCIAFNPANEALIAGGCTNGTIVLWDMGPHVNRMRNRRRETRKVNSLNTLEGYVDESSVATPEVYPAALTSAGHQHFVTGLKWLQDPLPNRTNHHDYCKDSFESYYQLVSTSDQREVKFWDIRPPPGYTWPKKKKNPMAPVESFLYLKNRWTPFLSVKVYEENREEEDDLAELVGAKREKPTELFYCINTFCRLEDDLQVNTEDVGGETELRRQESTMTEAKDRSCMSPSNLPDTFKKLAFTPQQSYDAIHLPSNTGPGKVRFFGNQLDAPGESGLRSQMYGLGNVTSAIFLLGTDEGKIVKCDFSNEDDSADSRGRLKLKPESASEVESAPIIAIQFSPFIKDVFIVLSKWSFSVWKYGFDKALLRSKNHNCKLTDVVWSLTQSSTFFVTRNDGFLDGWNLLEKTDDPLVSQKISDVKLCCVSVKRLSHKLQFVCCGDTSGVVFLLHIPSSLREEKPGELRSLQNYFERERQHQLYMAELRENRPTGVKVWQDSEALGSKLKTLFTSNEAAEQQALQQEFQEYLDLEYELQHKLGIYNPDWGSRRPDNRSYEEDSRSNNTSGSNVTSVSKVASDFTYLIE